MLENSGMPVRSMYLLQRRLSDFKLIERKIKFELYKSGCTGLVAGAEHAQCAEPIKINHTHAGGI